MPYKLEYRKGHKNSEGESAPWCIINKDSGKVVGSSKSEESGRSAIRARLWGEHKK